MLVRRGVPIAALAAIFALQALTDAGPVVTFPLYLAVVLIVALQANRTEAIAVGIVAGMALVSRPVILVQDAADLAAASLLAAVLVALAVVVTELSRHSRDAAATADRKTAELAARELRLRTALEAATVGFAVADLEGRWITLNEPFAALLGRARDELMRMTLTQITAQPDRVALDQALAALRFGDMTQWKGELGLSRPDGGYVPVETTLARIPGPNGGEGLLMVQALDLRPSRRADALRDCLAATRQVMASSTDWEHAMPQLLGAFCTYLEREVAQYWTIDPDRRLSVRYTASSADSPYEPFLQAGMRGVRLGSGLIGRAWQGGVLASDEDLERAGSDYERRDIARTVGLRSIVAFPVVDAGEVVGIVELASIRAEAPQDDEVTLLAATGVEIGQFIHRSEVAQALRRSEADHRAIYERSPIGIARISSSGELLEANPALLRMLEHDEETMRSTAWPELLRTYDQTASRQHKAPILAGITDGSTVQFRAATGSGNWLWLQMTATSIPDVTGRPEHVLVLVEDVTTVRETSDKLAEALDAQREANSSLERLDRTKSEFLSIVSHEFRTALTGIQGFSELIRDGGLEPDEVRAYGGYIFNDADRVNRLIGDMLDLDRMESGRMTIRTATVDLNEVLTEAVSRAAASSVTVEFKADLDPRLPIVAGDRDRLIQVMSNLVNNAVKYSPEGGNVSVSSRVEGGFALVSVTDTGIGIPADEIGHVFERFRRVRSGAAQSIPGTGLGLTIVKQIVEMHGGKIWVESALGHGSSFHFTIPLAAEGAGAVQLRHA
jgi:PAS domain S-box-containing protein